ncbi:NADH-ubiquinone oxidoreductase-F iron-sulfur binding region domain-containing protein [Actinokineospora sp. 24-640]
MSAPAPVRHDSGPRLLRHWAATGRECGLAEHAQLHGPQPLPAVPDLIRAVGESGLRGRGGAWFPAGRKLGAVAENAQAAGAAHVIVNGAESEPAAGKDKLLLAVVPHLVLDGAELAALAVGAGRITVCVHRGTGLADRVRHAVAERVAARWGGGVPVDVVEPPRWYVSSESTALANFVGGGPGKPRSVSSYKSGVDGKPTLVSNVETLAHLAQIARYGPAWFRAIGTAESPGTALYSVTGAVRRAGVHELPVGATGREILAAAGGPSTPVQAVLVGGYGGNWVTAEELRLPFSPDGLAAIGASPGAGVLAVLPPDVCGLAETVRIASWMGAQNARQCGPCFNGLPAIADDLARVTWGGDRTSLDRLRFRMARVDRRGACAHPDGVVRLVGSALRVFGDHIGLHLRHHGCPHSHRRSYFPLPTLPDRAEGWR